jgi:hypothetical protein
MNPIDLVLSRLAGRKLRETSRGRWRAACPGHDGKNVSALAVSEGDDGRALLHCFHGCEVEQIVTALGLTLADLMPPRPVEAGGGHAPLRHPFLPEQVLDVALFEIQVAAIVISDHHQGREPKKEDHDRLLLCWQRLDAMKGAAYGRRR